MPKTKHDDELKIDVPPVAKVAPPPPYDLNRTLDTARGMTFLGQSVRALIAGLNAQINAALADQHLSPEALDRIDQVFLEAEQRHGEIMDALVANAEDLRHGTAAGHRIR